MSYGWITGRLSPPHDKHPKTKNHRQANAGGFGGLAYLEHSSAERLSRRRGFQRRPDLTLQEKNSRVNPVV
jgi:hypothetical protein